MEELNTQPIMEFIGNYVSLRKDQVFSSASFQNPHPDSPLPFETTKIFMKTLQTLARGRHRPMSLRHGRLMMMSK
jgi:hypothetical protein